VREELALAPRGKFSARKVLSGNGGHRKKAHSNGRDRRTFGEQEIETAQNSIPMDAWRVQTKSENLSMTPSAFRDLHRVAKTTMCAVPTGAISR
jgi:hypothetical protein